IIIFFFFQAEDGIRDFHVTGVQTCALPIFVVGGGMVAHRFTEALRARDADGRYSVTVLAEEPRAPYDRVALTTYFTGRHPEDLEIGRASRRERAESAPAGGSLIINA